MRKLIFAIAVLALLIAVTTPAEAKKCSIEGTWYGANELGEHFVHSIIKTGPGKYKAIAQGPALAPDPATYQGVIAPFFGVHGELEKTGPRTYRSTWLLVWMVDEAIYGLPLLAIVPYGEIEMRSCNGWKSTFGTDVYLYDYGQDPFKKGVLVNSLEPYKASYKRLRQYRAE